MYFIELWPLCEPRPGVSLADGLRDSWSLQCLWSLSLFLVPVTSLSSLKFANLKTCPFTYTTENLEREFDKEMRQVTVITCRTVLTRNLLICSSPIYSHFFISSLFFPWVHLHFSPFPLHLDNPLKIPCLPKKPIIP